MRKLTDAASAVENLYEKRQMGYITEDTAQFTVKKSGNKLQIFLGDGTLVAESTVNAARLYEALFEASKKVGSDTAGIFIS